MFKANRLLRNRIYVLRAIGIGQLERRKVAAYRIVPAHLPFIDERGDGRGGEGFR